METLASLAVALRVNLSQVILEPVENGVDRRKEVVEDWLLASDRRDITALVECYHPEAVVILPGKPFIPFSGEHRGRDAILRVHELAWQTVKNASIDAGYHCLMDCEEAVVLRGYVGIHAADGILYKLSYVQIFNIEDQLILEHHVEYDTLALHRLLQM